MSFDARAFFQQFAAAINGRDREAMRSLVHVDFVSEIPQSGERSRGFEEFWAQVEQYPGGAPDVPPLPEVRLLGDEDRWVITPAYTVVPMATPTEFTFVSVTRYPDGTPWHIVGLIELRDNKLYRMENYFAPEMPAPLCESIPTWARGD